MVISEYFLREDIKLSSKEIIELIIFIEERYNIREGGINLKERAIVLLIKDIIKDSNLPVNIKENIKKFFPEVTNKFNL